MESINDAFYFVCDKIISLQAFFIGEAKNVGRVVLLIAICTAALNYALTGSGLKENIIKIMKALVFFLLVISLYPRIVSFITSYTYNLAKGSAGGNIETFFNTTKSAIAEQTDDAAANGKKGTFGNTATKSEKVSEDKNPALYFTELLKVRTAPNGKYTYTTVAPAACLQAILLVAGECMRFSNESASPKGMAQLPTNIGGVIAGTVCAFFVILTGIFGVLEYLIAFLEFMLVTSVGIILFPLMIWDGSKFMSEKFIGAVVGFFIKLLFCNLCIFLMLFGYLTLAKKFTATPFTGLIDEIVVLFFVCLLFFYICKSAPALAQSLLTGAPSLNAAGAIGAAGAAIGTAAAVGGLGAAAAGTVASGGAKLAFAGMGAMSQASGSAEAVKDLGGGFGAQAGAFMSSLGGSAKEGIMSMGQSAASGGRKSAILGGFASTVCATHKLSALSTAHILVRRHFNNSNVKNIRLLRQIANVFPEIIGRQGCRLFPKATLCV